MRRIEMDDHRSAGIAVYDTAPALGKGQVSRQAQQLRDVHLSDGESKLGQCIGRQAHALPDPGWGVQRTDQGDAPPLRLG